MRECFYINGVQVVPVTHNVKSSGKSVQSLIENIERHGNPKFRWHMNAVDYAAVKAHLANKANTPIGSGPWPDDEDTGDPPSTQPQGTGAVPPTPSTWVLRGWRSTDGFEFWLPDKKAPAKASGPCVCKKCKESNEYAEPNQPDGGYVCYRCR